MELSNKSIGFSSSSIPSWCINDTVNPEAIVTSSDSENYDDFNLTLGQLCNFDNSKTDEDEDNLSPS
jgi:hypothetical protein